MTEARHSVVQVFVVLFILASSWNEIMLVDAWSPGMYQVDPYIGTGGDGYGVGSTPVGAHWFFLA